MDGYKLTSVIYILKNGIFTQFSFKEQSEKGYEVHWMAEQMHERLNPR